MSSTDPKCEFLRHTLATLAYRGAKPLRDAPVTFADFDGAGRTPAQILAHLGLGAVYGGRKAAVEGFETVALGPGI